MLQRLRDLTPVKWLTRVAFPFGVILILAYVYIVAIAVCTSDGVNC
jgi:hypothetical protein